MLHGARTILILEDEKPLIALDLQTMLEAEGFRNIEVIGTCADAENLGDESNAFGRAD